MADPKPRPRIKDPELMRILHADPRKECALSGLLDGLELHHVLPKSQRGDDVRENLVFLASEHHRAITANMPWACRALGYHIVAFRPDTIRYLRERLPQLGKDADDWMRRRLYIEW